MAALTRDIPDVESFHERAQGRLPIFAPTSLLRQRPYSLDAGESCEPRRSRLGQR